MNQENIDRLAAVLGTIQQRLDATRDDPATVATDRFGGTGDFRPAHSRAEQQLLDETRHKHQSQLQRVDPVEAATHPSVATEPQRLSNLTVATAQKQIPVSAITFCNENAFDVSLCNAQNLIDQFKLQFPGDIIHLLFKGSYDDAARGDGSYSRRRDHIVELAQRNTPNWDSGTLKWAHHGIEYTVSRAFLNELKRLLSDNNGMRGSPWASIHPNDANFPVSEPSGQFNDLGCYDQNGPSVIGFSKQTLAHNPPGEFFAVVAGIAAIDPTVSILNSVNIRHLPRDLLVPYFFVNTAVEDLIQMNALNVFSNVLAPNELLSRVPIYIVNDPSNPPPCPCDLNGRPLALFNMSPHGLQRTVVDAPGVPDSDFLLLSGNPRSRNQYIKAWWKTWHDEHPYRPPPPVYAQYNPSFCPERAITRHEFNVFDSVVATMLVTFAEKKKVRSHDLDCIEEIRALKPSSSMTKDIADILLKHFPEDHSTIVTGYRKLFERVFDKFDGERMLPQYLISYLHEINSAIQEIGKPDDVFSKARELEVFTSVFDDAYYSIPESVANDEYFRELQKLAKRLRKPESFPDSDRYKVIALGGIDKINMFLIELGAEHNMSAPRPPQLVFIRHGAPAQAEYVAAIEELRATGDDDLAPQLPSSDERLLLQRLRSTPMGVAAARAGGVPVPRLGAAAPTRNAGPGRRQPARPPSRQRPAPYWSGAPAVSHPSAGGGQGNAKRDGDDRDRQRDLLKKMISQRVPPPLATSNPVAASSAPASAKSPKAPFPRKDSGKLVFPQHEFQTLNGLRRAYEDVDVSNVTDPKLKKLLTAVSEVASLLNIDNIEFDESPDEHLTEGSAPSSTLDEAIDNVLAIANTSKSGDRAVTVDELGEMLDKVLGDATPHLDESLTMTTDLSTTTDLFAFDELTRVQHIDVELCHRLATETKSIVLFDSCASRCFEKNILDCIDGTYMELKVKPLVRQASALATGTGLALRHYNIPLDYRSKTCMTLIGPPMIVPSFTDPLSIVSMDEFAHLGVIIQGAVPPSLPCLNAVSRTGSTTSLPLALTNTKMPYFISIPDKVVEAEGWTRLNTNMEPYTDKFAIEQILRNKEGLLAHNLMKDNLKAAYTECLDQALLALSSASSSSSPPSSASPIVVTGRMSKPGKRATSSVPPVD